MKLKYLLVIGFLFLLSQIQAQTQLKYSFSVDKNNTETVQDIIKESLGEWSTSKKNKIIWLKKLTRSEYKISIKSNKVRIYYKGKDNTIERKIEDLYTELKKN